MAKYKTGIVAIAKNENPYILEWLAYHLAIGFDHIWIYDNESTTPLSRMVSRFHSRKHVTFVSWPETGSGRTQIEAYNHFLRRQGRSVAWAAVIDLDEMICLNKDHSIHAFLDRFDDATGVALNWRFFGSAGHKVHGPGLMMERFQRAARIDARVNEGVKSLHRLETVAFLLPHYALYRDREAVVSASGLPVPNDWRIPLASANFAIAQVNHYFVKSVEEWDRKIARHRRYSTDDRDGYFEQLDRNEVEDISILTHLSATQVWMHQLRPRYDPWGKLLDVAASVEDCIDRVIYLLAGISARILRLLRSRNQVD
jgi:hypothetical protein